MVLLSRFDRARLIPQCTSVEICHCPFAGKVELLKWGWDKARQPHNCRSGVQAARGWLGFSSTTDSFFPLCLQALQKDKMGEAYSEIGKKGDVSTLVLFDESL